MEENKKLWVDPPSGWKYGFPKVYDPSVDNPNVVEWIVEQGYLKLKAEFGE